MIAVVHGGVKKDNVGAIFGSRYFVLQGWMTGDFYFAIVGCDCLLLSGKPLQPFAIRLDHADKPADARHAEDERDVAEDYSPFAYRLPRWSQLAVFSARLGDPRRKAR